MLNSPFKPPLQSVQNSSDLVEKREFHRDQANDLCDIRFADNKMTTGCLIEDISIAGAKLKVSCGDLPSRFILVNHTKKTRTLCRIVWRNGNQLGVHFITAPRSVSLDEGNNTNHRKTA